VGVVATGTIADRPFGRTFAAIAQRRFTGDLRLQAGTQRHVIGFRDGALVAAEGRHPADSAVKTALAAGLITSSQASEIVRAVRPESDDVAVVGELARLGPEHVMRLRRRVLANRAMRLFAAEAGEFALDDTPALPVPEVVPIDVRVIIYQGARAHFADERFTRELAALGDTFRLAVEPDALDGFGFGEIEGAILEVLAARALGPAALLDALPDAEPRVALAVLYAVATYGYCEIGGARAAAPTRPPAKPPTAPAHVAAPPTIAPPSARPARGKASVDADAIRALVAARRALLEADADHFAILGVERDASADAIRAAYFDVARQLHPDRITATGLDDVRLDAQRVFARINAAFGIVSHPQRRAEYVATLRAGGEAAIRKQQDEADATAARIFAAEDHFRAGEMALRRNHLEAAAREFEQAVRLNPDEPEHQAMLAWARWCLAPDKVAAGKAARAQLDQAAQRSPQNPVPALILGKIARGLGNDEEAARHFRRVLQVSPGHVEAASELRVVEARLGPQPRR